MAYRKIKALPTSFVPDSERWAELRRLYLAQPNLRRLLESKPLEERGK
jgi:hypothetical protein